MSRVTPTGGGRRKRTGNLIGTCREPLPVNLDESLLCRLSEKVQYTDTCWLWTGARTSNGYGNISATGGRAAGTLMAHRVVYTLTFGAVPEGRVLDHTCRTRHCVRPDHLEPVTVRENLRRGAAARRAA